MNISQENLENIFQNSSNILQNAYILQSLNRYLKYSNYLIGVPQAFLNGFVVIIIVLGLFRSQRKFNPGLIFVLNLALSNLLQAILVVSTGQRYIIEVDEQFLSTLNINKENGINCQLGIGGFSFIYTQATVATVLIAMDRYITITYWATHSKIMTKKLVLGFIITFSWCLPIIMFVGGYFNTEPTHTFCDASHLKSKYWLIGLAFIITLALCIVYILYFKIIFSFWKLKRKRSTIMRENKRIVEDIGFCMAPRRVPFVRLKAGIVPIKQSWSTICKENAFNSCDNVQPKRGDNLQKIIQRKPGRSSFHEQIYRIGRYIKDSKYVVIILTAFTISWLPWCAIFVADLFQHEVGYFSQEKQNTCRDLQEINATLSQNNKINIYFGLRYVMQAENSTATYLIHPYEIEETYSNYCSIIYDTLHGIMIENIQHVMCVISFINSVFNPLIYAIWYQDFRLVVKDVFKCS